MSITSRVIVDDSTQTTRTIVVDYIFHTDEVIRKRFSIGLTDDAMTEAIANDQIVLDEMARHEIGTGMSLTEQLLSPEILVQHQEQADYDRRILGRMMMVEDAHQFYAAYPFFQAVEARGGANANQRAAYLGITSTDYGMIDDRFSNVSGIAWFLTDEKNMLWTELPTDFE